MGFFSVLGSIFNILSCNLFKPSVISSLGDEALKVRQAITGDFSESGQVSIANKQSDQNIAEITTGNTSWRTFIGKCCALAFAYMIIICPFINWTIGVYYSLKLGEKIPNLPPLDKDLLMNLTYLMLGLGVYKTVEKIKGVKKC